MARSALALHRKAGYMNATGHLHHHSAALRNGAGPYRGPYMNPWAGQLKSAGLGRVGAVIGG